MTVKEGHSNQGKKKTRKRWNSKQMMTLLRTSRGANPKERKKRSGQLLQRFQLKGRRSSASEIIY